jgi:hypothetical protein
LKGIEPLALSYYIYYRVAQPVRAQSLVRDIQSAVKSRSGIAGRLLRKRDDPATWMEIYEGVDDAPHFEQNLVSVVQAADFASVMEPGGTRHMECFED